MEYKIRCATSEDYPQMMEIWESAVKATHDFLTEDDFKYFKKVIPRDYLPALAVYMICEGGKAKGFAAAAGGNLEMLFIHNESRGKGLGKKLYQFMQDHTGIGTVDVNEQNLQAIGFYEKLGFKRVGRSEKDSSGKNYPIIHMSL